MSYQSAYRDDSDADDEFERSDFTSPIMQGDFEDDGIDSEPPSPEHTPTTTFSHTAGHVSPQGRITEWSSDQAADFVSGLGLDQYANGFVDEGISGAELVELQHADLKDMGIDSFGHRLTILKSIYEVKVKQNLPLDPDHFIPLSADAGNQVPTQDDISRIIRIIKDRDERIHSAESELRVLKDDLNRLSEENRKLREEFLPLARLAKQNLPLPMPDAASAKNASPTLLDGRALTDSSSLDPSAAALTASNHLAATMRDGQPATSPHTLSQPSPTSPAYSTGQPSRNFPRESRDARGVATDEYPHAWQSAANDHRSISSKSRNTAGDSSLDPPNSGNSLSNSVPLPSAGLSTPTTIPSQSSGSSNPQVEIFKSFRVSIDDPCHKVLPVALKKYNITADWRQYALYIVHGDQERCLGLNEKPLILFKQLDREGRKPMFMLRKHAQPMEGHVSTVTGAGGAGRDSVGGWGGGGVQIPGGVL